MQPRSRLFHAIVVMGLSVGCGNASHPFPPGDAGKDAANDKDAAGDAMLVFGGADSGVPELDASPTNPDAGEAGLCPWPCYI